MQCPTCGMESRRFGRDRTGNQRYQCVPCRRTFQEAREPALDARRVPSERAVFVLRLLLEGSSIRSVERLTNTHRDTIMRLLVAAGERAQTFLELTLRDVPVNDVQCDELWAFIGCKEKVRLRENYSELFGDAYTFTAIERHTKLLIAWHLGKRQPEDALQFGEKLSRATSGRFQITTDGWTPYRTAIPLTLDGRVDFAALVKEYAIPEGDERRYSPPVVVGTSTVVCWGNPDLNRVCTSHVERQNLTIRMACRRFTRLTNAFSKKWENHEAALGLLFAYYNFCRPHMTLNETGRKVTPAMATGLADHVWTVEELLTRISAQENGSTRS